VVVKSGIIGGLGFVLAAVVLALSSSPASSQQLQGCQDHEQMILRLQTRFHEERADVAMNQYGWLIELFEAADGKTWTLVATRPGGLACVFGVGIDWQTVAPAAGDPS
jgi:hypothetical protein